MGTTGQPLADSAPAQDHLLRLTGWSQPVMSELARSAGVVARHPADPVGWFVVVAYG
jgi:hypothetical protein